MKILRYKNARKWGETDRFSNAFFIIGSIVVFTAVFFLGMQIGRIVEKDQVKKQDVRNDEGSKKEEIQQDMSAYSEEAVRIPVVMPPLPPPGASEELRESEETATFPDSLTRNDAAAPKPSTPAPAPKPAVTPSTKKTFVLQAGALSNREAADELKTKLEKKGYKSAVLRESSKGKVLYKVRVGPYGSREEATRQMKNIRAALKIDAIIIAE